MRVKPVFVKRKKFTEKPTAESRLLDRWDQQVFFIIKTFPHAASAIARIQEDHATRLGAAFVPSEESLADLAALRQTLR